MLRGLVLLLSFVLQACMTTAPSGGADYGGQGCTALEIPEGTESISYYSRNDRREDRFLKAKGFMILHDASCERRGNKLVLNAMIDIGYDLGRLGRINQNDKAIFLFPYAIMIVDDNQKVLVQDTMETYAHFEAHQVSARTNEIITKEYTLPRSAYGKNLSVFIGFIQSAEGDDAWIERTPPANKLISKPDPG